MLVDEAHAFGVIGPEGKGLSHDIFGPLEMISGTFGKAFGGGGAFLACNKELGNQLLQKSGAFHYTTALSPPLAAAALASLKLIKDNPQWGREIQQNAKRWRLRLSAEGWTRPPGFGQILSLIIGPDQKALDQQKRLEAENLLSVAIRPPTVPEGKARLRIALRKGLPDEALGRLIQTLKS